MIRLKDLIVESEASEEAKRRGLVHIGGGNYAQKKGGPTVARTVKGKLVPVNGKETAKKKPSRKDEQNKRMQQQIVELAELVHSDDWSGAYTSDKPDDVDARKAAALKIIQDQINPDEQTIYLHPYRKIASKLIANNPKYTHSIDNEYDLKEAIKDGFIKEGSEEEKMAQLYCDLVGETGARQHESHRLENVTPEWGQEQHRKWIPQSRFGHDDIEDLRALTEDLVTWVSSGNWKSSREDERRWRNHRINHLSWNGGKPTRLSKEVKTIERGMNIPPEDIGKFLESFAVGKEVGLPPSGWTTRPKLAREFGGGDKITRGVNVQLRLKKPKYGLHLNGLKGAMKDLVEHHIDMVTKEFVEGIEDGDFGEDTEYQDFYERFILGYPDNLLYDDYEGLTYEFESYINELAEFLTYLEPKSKARGEKWDRVHFQLEQLRQIADNYTSWSPYDDECEVIRPGWASNKVKSIKKYVSHTGGWSYGGIQAPEVTYVIELEEGDVIKDPQLFVEFQRKKPKKLAPTSVTKKYTNTPVVPFRKTKSKKKKPR